MDDESLNLFEIPKYENKIIEKMIRDLTPFEIDVMKKHFRRIYTVFTFIGFLSALIILWIVRWLLI